MHTDTFRPRLAALAFAIVLGGCGGGGGDAPTTAPAGDVPAGGDVVVSGAPPDGPGDGSSGGPGDGTAAESEGGGDGVEADGSRFSYRLEPAADSVAAFVAAGNALGAVGYRFQSSSTFDAAPPFTLLDIYVRDERAPGRYAVRVLPDGDDPDALLAEMNAEGADGYAFRAPITFGVTPGASPETFSFYLRDESAPSTFAYEALPVVTSAAALLEQANAQGERGFRYLSPLAFGGGAEQRAFYVLEVSAAGRLDYRAETRPADGDGLIEQANRLGAAGYLYRGDVFTDSADFTGPGGVLLSLYRRDASRSGTFAYALDEPAGSADAFLAQTLSQGEANRLFAGAIADGPNDFTRVRALYVDVSGCDCEPLRVGDPFTY